MKPTPHLITQVRHEHYRAEFASHLTEEEHQKQAEAEFKVGLRLSLR